MSNLGNNLKRLRAKTGLSLRAIEMATGISNCNLSPLETGATANPTLKTVLILCQYFDVTLDQLVLEKHIDMQMLSVKELLESEIL